jgi:RHS repeat-associated protein
LLYYPGSGTPGQTSRRLQRITHKKPNGTDFYSRFEYTYSADGQITTWRQQDDASRDQTYAFGYDPANQLTSARLQETSGGALVSDLRYTYDPAGNRTGVQTSTPGAGSTVNVSPTSATYNSLNQLTGLDRANGPVYIRGTVSKPASSITVQGAIGLPAINAARLPGDAFEAKIGGLTTNSRFTVTATDFQSPTPEVKAQVFEVTAGTPGQAESMTYDLNGNLTEIRVGTTLIRKYRWDALNRLVGIDYFNSSGTATGSTDIAYDGFSRRYRITEKDASATVTSDKLLLWCGTSICEERTATDTTSTVVKRYFAQGVQVPGAASPADKLFYTRDHLGSVRELVDSASTPAVRARYAYDPYGRVTKLSGDLDADFLFTGHYYHAKSGLHLAPYRAYDAGLGRWISRDPITEDGGINLYVYVANSPVNYVDLLGLQRTWSDWWARNRPFPSEDQKPPFSEDIGDYRGPGPQDSNCVGYACHSKGFLGADGPSQLGCRKVELTDKCGPGEYAVMVGQWPNAAGGPAWHAAREKLAAKAAGKLN